MELDIGSAARLSNGVEMPFLGLGTYLIPEGRAAQKAVPWALDAGCRHVDTARLYENESDVGAAVGKSEVPREDTDPPGAPARVGRNTLVLRPVNTVSYRESRCAVPARRATEAYSVSTERKRNAAGADAAAIECKRIYGTGY